MKRPTHDAINATPSHRMPQRLSTWTETRVKRNASANPLRQRVVMISLGSILSALSMSLSFSGKLGAQTVGKMVRGGEARGGCSSQRRHGDGEVQC